MKITILTRDTYQDMREAPRGMLATFDSAYWPKADLKDALKDAIGNGMAVQPISINLMYSHAAEHLLELPRSF